MAAVRRCSMWFLLWLAYVYGVPCIHVFKADNAKKASLKKLEGQMYADQTGRASWTLSSRVPLFKEWDRFHAGYFRSDVFSDADQVRSYMKAHPCIQYEKPESDLDSTKCASVYKDTFLLWMFSSSSAIRGHTQLNCTDIRTAFNLFWRFYSGTYEHKDEPIALQTVTLNIVITVICFCFSKLRYSLGEFLIIFAIICIPVELFILLILDIKAKRSMRMCCYDFLIRDIVGGKGIDRIISLYAGVSAARVTRSITKKRW